MLYGTLNGFIALLQGGAGGQGPSGTVAVILSPEERRLVASASSYLNLKFNSLFLHLF